MSSRRPPLHADAHRPGDIAVLIVMGAIVVWLAVDAIVGALL